MAPSARSRFAPLAAMLSLPLILAMRDASDAKGVLVANEEAPESLGQLEMRSLAKRDQAASHAAAATQQLKVGDVVQTVKDISAEFYKDAQSTDDSEWIYWSWSEGYLIGAGREGTVVKLLHDCIEVKWDDPIIYLRERNPMRPIIIHRSLILLPVAYRDLTRVVEPLTSVTKGHTISAGTMGQGTRRLQMASLDQLSASDRESDTASSQVAVDRRGRQRVNLEAQYRP